MNQTLPTADLNTAGTTDVIPSVAIDRIIAQRNEGIALFMQAMECLATARRILLDASGDIFLYGFEDCVTDSVRRMDKPEEAKRNITRLADRKIWDRLMTDTGMYTFMSSCQRDEWNSQLMSDTCPEIILDNVLATFRHLNASKMQTFEQGLIDVYRKLSWDYRTNNPCRLGKRIIIENLLYRWSNGRVTLDCSGREALGFAPIFPDTCYHLTHYWPAAVDIPVASDNPVHYADAIRYNARTPLQGSLLPLTRLV